MARLRPARTCRIPNSQAWARYSLRKPRKNYVRALPHSSLNVFKTGVDSGAYDTAVTLDCERLVQLRSNALEAARIAAGKYLEANIPGEYWFTLSVYPHNVIREKRMATGAGADRISQGMTLAFGKPVSVAARVRPGQPVFLIKINGANLDVAKKALKRAMSKLSGSYRISSVPILAS
ncbi:MAG: 50S ribosomal protein L16 [Candidatus Marsarchaeota archaeon]|jgi:large subunit ribosomal protein L10e|nr:50S ribosomal protein L16 [Candidatus Marsarchaeota archaeon]MCL5111607.1 50S ribosomal protein L16 [Candidatus Marsarchaeota archaeon]